MNVFKLENYLGQYEFRAPYLLCCSDPESFAMEEIVAMASREDRKLWNELRLGYTEVRGLPLLRETIAEQLYAGFRGDDILCFAAAEEGIFCSLFALCEPGDHVIVLTPCYQSLKEIPKLKGCALTEITLKEENQWRIDIEAIQKEIRPSTKGVIINFPQ